MFADIEEIVVRELGGLCHSCAHHDTCVYRLSTDKVVIQCEVFESSAAEIVLDDCFPEKGLCLNCNKRQSCHLPKQASGVWHCEEYE